MTDRAPALAELRARSALRRAGLDPALPLAPAPSATNEVWVGPQHVIRVSGGISARLAREAFLARHLPGEVGYPAIVTHGSGVGDDWLVVERAPGGPLAHRWPDLDRTSRRRAVTQLAERLRALHRTPVPAGLPPIERQPQLLDLAREDPLAPALDGLGRAAALGHVDDLVAREAEALLRTAGEALHGVHTTTLVHGDLTFENLLWEDGHVTALLDLEWSRGGPPDLDLDVLLRMCAHPHLHVAARHEARTRAEDYWDVPRWLAEDYPELFDVPRLADRLRGYCLAYDLRELREHPPRSGAALPALHPVHRIRRVVRGESHLDELVRAGLLA